MGWWAALEHSDPAFRTCSEQNNNNKNSQNRYRICGITNIEQAVEFKFTVIIQCRDEMNIFVFAFSRQFSRKISFVISRKAYEYVRKLIEVSESFFTKNFTFHQHVKKMVHFCEILMTRDFSRFLRSCFFERFRETKICETRGANARGWLK